MAGKRKALGAGLGGGGINALIPPAKSKGEEKKTEEKSAEKTAKRTEIKTEKKTEKVDITSNEMLVKISRVGPNKEQPRKQFNEDALLELSESMKQYGVLQPILVTKKGDYFEIIAGERRWRAAKLAGLKEVPVIVKEYTEQEIIEISLIENIQREDLNPIEEAKAYQRLSDEFNMKQDQIAEKVSRSRTTITNAMRLLKLSEKVQQMLIDDMITSGHARALLSVENEELQETLAAKVFDEKLSVRETEKLVKTVLSPPKKRNVPSDPAQDAVYQSLEEKMKTIMGTKVSINRRKNHRGKIEIEYYSQAELERIIDLFESIH